MRTPSRSRSRILPLVLLSPAAGAATLLVGPDDAGKWIIREEITESRP